MKSRSLQSKLFLAYLGMAILILFSFAIFSMCLYQISYFIVKADSAYLPFTFN